MQDVSGLPLWGLVEERGEPDLYYTEYFRVHVDSHLDKEILRSITGGPPGRLVIAQMIGNDIPALLRTARELQKYPVAAIDLNLGCPAPVVYRKCAGGGLLREPQRIDTILGALRDAVSVAFTVKTRLGFADSEVFSELLPIFARHSLDLLTVHGRTVAERYKSEVHYELIGQAAEALPCPVLANGNVSSPAGAAAVLESTGVRGLMLGRGAIRNPWLFRQIRQHLAGEPLHLPYGRDVLAYIRGLYEATDLPEIREHSQVQSMKKFMNFIALGSPTAAEFLHAIRRASTRSEFFELCERHLEPDELMPLEPMRVEDAVV